MDEIAGIVLCCIIVLVSISAAIKDLHNKISDIEDSADEYSKKNDIYDQKK